MKRITLTLTLTLTLLITGANLVHAQTNPLDHLYQLKDAQTRSISPENFTGEKGKGGMATLEEGSAAHAARELGQGWKVNPYVHIEPGDTFTLGEIDGSGVINHIWMTPVGDYRLMIFRFYWDGETEPSIEVPVGDFFASGWGMGNEPRITSLALCVNPRSGFNAYWQMPFRKGCKVTMENMGDKTASVYYQIDYSLEEVPENTPYFHAQFRRSNPLPYKQDYTILDGVKGRGQYVGTYLAHGANSPGWWGEGEIKFFIDGDGQFPTICGTGEEDYFNGSYGYAEHVVDGRDAYENFTSPYTGFYHVTFEGAQRRFGQYRWHITDPVRFTEDLRVTIQSLGWQSEGRYLPLEDDLASVAYWYQLEPHNPFPALPAKEDLAIVDEYPLTGMLDKNLFVDKTEVALSGDAVVEEIRYTLDGSEPGPDAILYAGPFTVTQNCTVKARGFGKGRPVTPVVVGNFIQTKAQPASNLDQPKTGAEFALITLDKVLGSTRELEGLKASQSGVTDALRLPEGGTPEQFGLVFQGFLNIPATGVYTFSVTSNDGSNLFVGNRNVVANDGAHSEREEKGQIALEAGYHPFRLDYFQAGGGKTLKVTVEGPALLRQEVPAGMLVH